MIDDQAGRKEKIPERFCRDLGNIARAAAIDFTGDWLFILALGKGAINDAVTILVHDRYKEGENGFCRTNAGTPKCPFLS